MNIKPIVKPPIKESLRYGDIISWKFREKLTPIRKTFAYRFELTFSTGVTYSMQRGGFTTKTEALRAKEITITELHNKDFVPFEYTLQEFYDFWLYYYMLDEKGIAYGTFCSYRNIIYNYILKTLDPKMKMVLIERNEIKKLLDSIESKSILHLTYTILRSSFIYAKTHQIIRLNPALMAIRTKKRMEKKALIQAARNGERSLKPKQYPILSLQQISQMLLQCKEKYPQMFLPLLLSLTTGLRISEVIAVKYADIDWWKGELRIRRQLGRSTENTGIEKGRMSTQELKTKSRSGNRDIPLAEFVIDELILARHKYETLQENNPDFCDLDFVCSQENGLPHNRSSFTKSFKRLLKDCCIPDMRWHDLRHTYATVLKENDISTKAISVCMGHNEAKITEDVYINLQEPVYDCDKEIDAFISELLPGKTPVLDIGINEKYLLAVLPQKRYNVKDYA